jgi:putative DNA primase/helicase
MDCTSTNPPIDSAHPSEELLTYAIFRLTLRLGKGTKARIKSLGCHWNPLHHGWICPAAKQEEIQKTFQAAAIQYETQLLHLPEGIIPINPTIARRESRLDIMEEQLYKNETELLQDIYQYNPQLRPEDFTQLPSEESKNQQQLHLERDFHHRYLALQQQKVTIKQAQQDLSHLNTDPGEKIFDSDAPLLIADALINAQFTQGQYRTLQHCSDSFWRWDGIKYIEMADGVMRRIIYDFLRDAKKLDEGQLASFNPTKFKVDQIVDALRAICHQNHHPAGGAIWLDQRSDPEPRFLISFKNGLLNMSDYLENPNTALMAHTPALLNANSLSFDYDSHAPEPQYWLQFLNSIWPNDLESQEALQEWAGYILIQDTRLHKILLIVGPPRSGKGTIGRIFRELFGDSNVIGPTLSSLCGEFGLQPFLNKMLAVISDARLNGKNNSTIIERLLSISGEDPLTVNRKFLPPLTVQLPTRIMIMSNELPDLRDASGALAKRYLVLSLQKSWYGQEDTSLLFRLRAELSGILIWALQGLARLQQEGKFIQPASSAPVIENLESLTSPIKAFVAERCELNSTRIVSVTALFNAWRIWCNMTGYAHTGNVQSFGKNLRAAFPEIEITRPQEDATRERCYRGIALSSMTNPPADVRGPYDEETN